VEKEIPQKQNRKNNFLGAAFRPKARSITKNARCFLNLIAFLATVGQRQVITGLPGQQLAVRVVSIWRKGLSFIPGYAMDTAIAALEQRRNKTKDFKQAMMQELLTGKTRLI